MCATDDFKFKIINNRLDSIEKNIKQIGSKRISDKPTEEDRKLAYERWEKAGLLVEHRNNSICYGCLKALHKCNDENTKCLECVNGDKKITLSLKAVGIANDTANDIAENFDTLINKWEGEMTKLLNDAGVNNVEDIVNPAYKHSCFAIRGCLMDVKELRKLALDACK
jgi:hypothetical protein